MDCWSCGAERGEAAFCGTCGKIQPLPRRRSFFALFEIEPTMRPDAYALGRLYRERSRRFHPDRFGRSSAVERRLALEHTAFMNEAYRALSDPQARAEHLMRLRGVEIGSEDARTTSQGILMEMLELGEAIDGAKDEGALAEHRHHLEARVERGLDRLERFFDGGEGTVAEATRVLDELRYVRRLLERIEAKRGS